MNDPIKEDWRDKVAKVLRALGLGFSILALVIVLAVGFLLGACFLTGLK